MERDLTAGERRRLGIVEAHLAAISGITRDSARVADLAALLADDFTWQTPSTHPAYGVSRDRATYLAILSRPDLTPQHERFADLEVKLIASTVEDMRIAGETISEGMRQDGLRYANRYHQLWRFDADDKIVEYRIYADTRAVDAVHAAGIERIALTFLDCLISGDADRAAGLLADPFRWIIRDGVGSEFVLDRPAALHRLGAEPQPGLEIASNGVRVCGDHVVVEALDSAAGWRQLFCRLEHGFIVEIRDYRSAGSKSSSWR